MYCCQKLSGRFCKILWPSQNIWTLPNFFGFLEYGKTFCFKDLLTFRAEFCLNFCSFWGNGVSRRIIFEIYWPLNKKFLLYPKQNNCLYFLHRSVMYNYAPNPKFSQCFGPIHFARKNSSANIAQTWERTYGYFDLTYFDIFLITGFHEFWNYESRYLFYEFLFFKGYWLK